MTLLSIVENQNMKNQNEEEVVTHSFSDQNELLDTIMNQETLFEAIRLANEINELNGYQVITKYEMKKIKDYYKNEKVENENTEIKSRNSDSEKSKMAELQKAYMKLLSE